MRSLSEYRARIKPSRLKAAIEGDRHPFVGHPFLSEIHTRDRTREFPSSEMVPGREVPGLAIARQIAGFGGRLIRPKFLLELSEQQR
jgi:hypothetical protein